MSIAMLASGITSVVGGFIGAGQARRAQDRAKKQMQREERAFNNLKRQRQDLTDLGNLAKDRSGDITNPFANIGVATQAAEFQAEEADVALANTLDTLRATGAGAGGATALAQAALRSKRDISASIQQQEAQNARLRAQGEAQRQTALMQEASRVQQARVAGEKFVFGATETRQMQQLNRLQSMIDNSQRQAATFRAASDQAIYGALGSVGGAMMGMTGDDPLGLGK